MEPDLELQRALLVFLRDQHPQRVSSSWPELPLAGTAALDVCVMYLADHGLIETGRLDRDNAGRLKPVKLGITARGLDFLRSDGGLTRQLSKIEVQLDDDQLRQLLASLADAAPLPPHERSWLQQQARELPAAALRALVVRLAETALTRVPDICRLAGMWLLKAGEN